MIQVVHIPPHRHEPECGKRTMTYDIMTREELEKLGYRFEIVPPSDSDRRKNQ